MATVDTVIAYYTQILRQPPTDAQQTLWVARIDAATDKAAVLEELCQSLILQADDVRALMRAYQGILGRAPDEGGLDYWLGNYRAAVPGMRDAVAAKYPTLQKDNAQLFEERVHKATLLETIKSWFDSAEFKAVFGNPTDEEFVNLLYQNVLGRPADQAGFDFWVSELKNGILTRQELVIAFTESVENKLRLDADANAILKIAAQLKSPDTADDPDFQVPGNNPWQGELNNDAPTDITLSANMINEQDEGGTSGALVANLAVVDPDIGKDPTETHTFKLVSQSVPGALKIVGTQLQIDDPSKIDAEAGVSAIQVVIRVTDQRGNSFEKTVTVNVKPLFDEAPTNILPDTAMTGATAAPNSEVADLSATDADAGDEHTFEITSDPTGAFGIVGGKLVLVDPSKVSSGALVDGGPADGDNTANGKVVVTLGVKVTDKGGKSHNDTITVTIDQTGKNLAFTPGTDTLEGTGGNDVFRGNAGDGSEAGRTVNAGDRADGGAGYDRAEIFRPDDDSDSSQDPVTGVALTNIEHLVLSNKDDTDEPARPTTVLPLLNDICTPIIGAPNFGPDRDSNLHFHASDSPDLDKVTIERSQGSVQVTDLQGEFWKQTPGDQNDKGPMVNIVDVTARGIWIDSDAQSKQFTDANSDGKDDGNIVIGLNEVRIEELRITEDANDHSPPPGRLQGDRGEQVGTITLRASGVRSAVGEINNGRGSRDATGNRTHTVNIEVGDLTGSRPTAAVGAAAALANTAAIDIFVGHHHGLGYGLVGLENVNISGGGDAFLVFEGPGATTDTDGDGFNLEIVDGAGSSTFAFTPPMPGQPGAFSNGTTGTSLDGGDGFDTVMTYTSDLNGIGRITNVERLVVLNDAAGVLDLKAFDGDLDQLILSAGVNGDLAIINVPDSGGTKLQSQLGTALGDPGLIINIDQCCDSGDLPGDFDLYISAMNTGTRVDTIFKTDANDEHVDNLNLNNISTFHLNVVDCDTTTGGLFEVRHLGSQDNELQTLLLSDDGKAGRTRILSDDARHDKDIGGTDANPLGSTKALSLINGTGSTRGLEFLQFAAGAAVGAGMTQGLKQLPVLEAWGGPSGPSGNGRPTKDGFLSEAANIQDPLVVSAAGVTANLGNGNDIISGNREADGVAGPAGKGLGADTIRAGGGNDLVFGAGGNDRIDGGTGNDELRGEAGNDLLFGRAGNDLITGDGGNDILDGGADNDILFGGGGNDLLFGRAGNDVLCGDAGDDSLFGGGGNDLLIGGADDDALESGASGTDVLVGDYGCGPHKVNVTIPTADLEKDDVFTVRLDLDGNGTLEAYTVRAPATPTVDGIATALADRINTALKGLSTTIQECWDIKANGGVLQICKVDTKPPVVQFSGVDAPVASVHKFALGGKISPSDVFRIELEGTLNTGTFGSVPGVSPPANGLFYDTVEELLTLSRQAVTYLNASIEATTALRGRYKVELDTDGKICVIGPLDGSPSPTITVTVTDGAAFDSPAVAEIQGIDVSGLTGLEVGDTITVSWAINGAAESAMYVVTAEDLIPGRLNEHIRAAIDARPGVSATIETGSPTVICVKSDTTGDPAGSFTTVPGVVVAEAAADNVATVNLTGLDTSGESLNIEIKVGAATAVNYSVNFNTSEAQTLTDFVAAHATNIFTAHKLVVTIEGGKLVFRGGTTGDFGPLADNILIDASIAGTGSASVVITTPGLTPGSVSVSQKQAPANAAQDDTETVFDRGVTVTPNPGTPLDLSANVNVVPVTVAGQDVFIGSARSFDGTLFAADGFDNDLMPGQDFNGLLDAAGRGTGNGADGGVTGVVYVMDFNQGGGGDDRLTFGVNEAFNKGANSGSAGDRFFDTINTKFPGNADRTNGDKLAFRKTDDKLDVSGSAANYKEDENNAASRDDADAAAFAAFNGNSDLRYYVSARTFEDALSERGYTWGVDFSQTNIEQLRLDLADNGKADGSAGDAALLNGRWGNAQKLLDLVKGADGDSWLRVYYNQAGTDAVPEAVMDLVGLDSKSQFGFEDIVGSDSITDPLVTVTDPFIA